MMTVKNKLWQPTWLCFRSYLHWNCGICPIATFFLWILHLDLPKHTFQPAMKSDCDCNMRFFSLLAWVEICNYMASYSPGFSIRFPIATILFHWAHHHCTCTSSCFSLTWSLNVITWGFLVFQSGMKCSPDQNSLHVTENVKRIFSGLQLGWNLSKANFAENPHTRGP